MNVKQLLHNFFMSKWADFIGTMMGVFTFGCAIACLMAIIYISTRYGGNDLTGLAMIPLVVLLFSMHWIFKDWHRLIQESKEKRKRL